MRQISAYESLDLPALPMGYEKEVLGEGMRSRHSNSLTIARSLAQSPIGHGHILLDGNNHSQARWLYLGDLSLSWSRPARPV